MSPQAAPPFRDARRFAPIFVLATAQSYSSVVATMIGQHPSLIGFPELKLFCCKTVGELESSLPEYWRTRGITHRSPGLVRALAEFEFGGQTTESLSAALSWLEDRRSWSGADVFDVLLERASPRIAVEKSPDNILTDASLTRMAKAYPQARYLHLTRHPVSTQRSMQEHLKQTVGVDARTGGPMSSIGQWYDVHRRILRFDDTLPAEQYLRVRAEDVLNDPESRLYAITQWLEISSDRDSIEAMQHPEASPFARPGPAGSGVVGGNNQKFLNNPIPHRVEIPCGLEVPEGWEADPSVWKLVTALACRLGYADPLIG